MVRYICEVVYTEWTEAVVESMPLYDSFRRRYVMRGMLFRNDLMVSHFDGFSIQTNFQPLFQFFQFARFN